MLKLILCGYTIIFYKKTRKKFVSSKKNLYLCNRYPENNLFTLKETNTY